LNNKKNTETAVTKLIGANGNLVSHKIGMALKKTIKQAKMKIAFLVFISCLSISAKFRAALLTLPGMNDSIANTPVIQYDNRPV